MNRLRFFVVAMVVAGGLSTFVGCNSKTAAQMEGQTATSVMTESQTSSEPQGPGQGMAALEQAATADRYLFAFFWKAEDAQTDAMRTVLKDTIKDITDRADSVEIDVTSASEKAIVKKFDLGRAPMPLILVLAPNGAITGGFPSEAEKQKLLDAFASPCTEKCMKQLQENKLVFLCVQNESTKLNDEALKGVRDFKADTRFAQATEIVMLDPTDTAEASFLKDLQVDPKTESAVTVFMAPPGIPVASYTGTTTKEELVTTLEKASSACGPGGSCGPGGCGPNSNPQ